MPVDFDLTRLPVEVREKLAELELELSEGDLTQKGYEKKKNLLLGPYLKTFGTQVAASPGTKAHRRHQRRLTRDENRFHSEIRAEAVQQALAEYATRRDVEPALLPPQRRKGQRHTKEQEIRRHQDEDSSSEDEDSLFGSADRKRPLSKLITSSGLNSKAVDQSVTAILTPVSTSNTPPIDSGDYVEVQPSSRAPPPDVTQNGSGNVRRNQATDGMGARMGDGVTTAEAILQRLQQHSQRQAQRSAEVHQRISAARSKQNGLPPRSPLPKEHTQLKDTVAEEDVVYANTHPNTVFPTEELPSQDYENAPTALKPAKVSLKIQQLLSNLQRPKTKPLHEFYNDDDAELEAMARVTDPSAPRPEGAVMSPVRGEGAGQTQTHQHTLPRSVDSALHRYGTTTPKAVVGVVLDHNGRPGEQLTYAKLLSRSNKVAFMLLNKTVSIGGKDGTKVPLCKAGDRVALVYPNTDPIHFLTAFYGCLLAGVVPVPVEVPLTKRDAGIQQLGFLLGSCGVRVALTSESCYKGLPKTTPTNGTQDVVDFKGWPRLHWVTTEHLNKPSRDWTAPPRVTDESVAYIEYSSDREGAVKGVCVNRQAMLAHCRVIAHAMDYKEGETIICVLDWKREVGLWHSVLVSVFCGLRVVFVPYSLMKINPASWMLQATKLHASTALVKSRDLHWALLATRDHKDVNLSALKSLVVADGANPWSLSSCDQFASTFASRGLRPDAMCPTAGSSETGTISLRRRSAITSASASGRGILSMSALSHSVVRVDQENSLTSLTLQDAGKVIPAGVVVVVKQNGPPRLCKADEVGEICVCAHSTGNAYWGLDGMSASTFRVEPLAVDDRPLGPLHYVRSGLIGFMGPDGLVFVVGRRSSQLSVSGRQHSADDIIATVLAVEPMRFVYRGRIAVFSVSVLRDERIVIVCEQKPGTSEDDAFQWMSRVLQAIDSIHQTGIYCLALLQANQLPKTPLGGIHVSETRIRFQSGELHPLTLLMCPHSCVLNLPKPRERQADVGPAAMFVGNIVQGVRMAAAQGRSLGQEENTFVSLVDVLRQRAAQSPDHVIFSLVTVRNQESPDQLTCSGLLRRAERICSLLSEKARLNSGDHVAIALPPGLELIAAFYGCLIAGMVPVCIRPPSASLLSDSLPSVRLIVDVSKAVAILSNQATIKLLKSKEACHRVDSKAWPMLLDIDDAPSIGKRKGTLEREGAKPAETCYIDFSVSTTGQLSGVLMSHSGASGLCKSLKIAGELYPSRHVSVCLDPYSGTGLALWMLSSVYSGHQTTLIPPSEVEASVSLWFQTVSALRTRDTFTSHTVIEMCIKQLAQQVPQLKERGINLNCVRTCVIVAEERPRVTVLSAFCALFSPLGLSSRVVSTAFGCRVNAAICMQGAAGPDPAQLWVDARALRHDRVTVVGRGAPHSIQLVESGKLLPGVRVVVANPDTRGLCADSQLGEIWVNSAHNGVQYAESTHTQETFDAKLTTGDTSTRWARTGYLGLIRQTDSVTESGGLHEAVFVVGLLEETLSLRGMRYHPMDIETTIFRAHKHVRDCAVFTWTHLLVAVCECSGLESEALDIVPMVTSAVLEEHHLILGVVVVVDPNTVPTNCRGEKQRTFLRDQFLHDKLDPIYVAYNM